MSREESREKGSSTAIRARQTTCESVAFLQQLRLAIDRLTSGRPFCYCLPSPIWCGLFPPPSHQCLVVTEAATPHLPSGPFIRSDHERGEQAPHGYRASPANKARARTNEGHPLRQRRGQQRGNRLRRISSIVYILLCVCSELGGAPSRKIVFTGSTPCSVV